MKKKTVIICWYSLNPPWTGGKMRTENILKNFRIVEPILISPSDYLNNAFDTYKINRSLISRIKTFYNPAILCYFSIISILQTFQILYKKRPQIIQYVSLWPFLPLLPFKRLFANSLHIIVIQNIESMVNKGLRAKMLKFFERCVYSRADLCVVMSDSDKHRLSHAFGISFKKILVVPNGVEIPQAAPKFGLVKQNQSPVELFFVGKLDYRPNREAVAFLCELSETLKTKLDTDWKIEIAGIPVPAKKCDGIHFKGYVENLNEEIKSADICLAPIFSGSGTRIKILEYLAQGRPVISTRLGAEGLGLVNEKHVIYAETLDEYIRAIEHILSKPECAREIGQNGYQFVKEKYSWQKIVHNYEKDLIAICQDRTR